mgnify:CR=1 FL=1
MLRSRIIPCLLIHDDGLNKTELFKPGKYLGDPLNAVKIFNEKEVDELMVLDIIQRVTTGIHAILSLIAVQNCLASEMSSKPDALKR